MSGLSVSEQPATTDFLIIGCGIIGLCIARTLKNTFPDQRITVIEKESGLSVHASGRNSGVLHAGFYYTADSLKAQFCRDGNRLMTELCLENQLQINQCGKLVVSRNRSELDTLDELYARGLKNGVKLEVIDEQQLAEIEPLAKTCERALWSPSTSTVDPHQVNGFLFNELSQKGVTFLFNTRFIKNNCNVITTSQGEIQAGFVINAAGLYADKVAQEFGFAADYTMLPFKGLYLYANENLKLGTNLYPVPDLKNPFLGVHFTLTANGGCKIGPTAIPAFWREQYQGLANFKLFECFETLSKQTRLLLNNSFNFRELAIHELNKYYKPRLIKLASQLTQTLSADQFTHWGKAGIRAQLLNRNTNTLEMDFLIENDAKSLHVLNAVSPAYTCSLAFASYVVSKLEQAA